MKNETKDEGENAHTQFKPPRLQKSGKNPSYTSTNGNADPKKQPMVFLYSKIAEKGVRSHVRHSRGMIRHSNKMVRRSIGVTKIPKSSEC